MVSRNHLTIFQEPLLDLRLLLLLVFLTELDTVTVQFRGHHCDVFGGLFRFGVSDVVVAAAAVTGTGHAEQHRQEHQAVVSGEEDDQEEYLKIAFQINHVESVACR